MLKRTVANTLISITLVLFSGCNSSLSTGTPTTLQNSSAKNIQISQFNTIGYAHIKDGDKLVKVSLNYTVPNSKEIEVIEITEGGFYPSYHIPNETVRCFTNKFEDSENNSDFCSSIFASKDSLKTSGANVFRTAALFGTNVLSGSAIYYVDFNSDYFLEIIKKNDLEKYRQSLLALLNYNDIAYKKLKNNNRGLAFTKLNIQNLNKEITKINTSSIEKEIDSYYLEENHKLAKKYAMLQQEKIEEYAKLTKEKTEEEARLKREKIIKAKKDEIMARSFHVFGFYMGMTKSEAEKVINNGTKKSSNGFVTHFYQDECSLKDRKNNIMLAFKDTKQWGSLYIDGLIEGIILKFDLNDKLYKITGQSKTSWSGSKEWNSYPTDHKKILQRIKQKPNANTVTYYSNEGLAFRSKNGMDFRTSYFSIFNDRLKKECTANKKAEIAVKKAEDKKAIDSI